MRKTLSRITAIATIVSSLSMGSLVYAQPISFLADVTIKFTGLSNRLLVIKAGSDAFTYTVNPTNLVLTLAQAKTFTIVDQGRAPGGERREISVSDGTGTGCVDEGSRLVLIAPGGNRTVTIAPTDIVISCGAPQGAAAVLGASSGGGGGSGGGSASPAPAPTPTPTPTPAPTPTTQESTITIFKDGKLVQVTPEELAQIKAQETAGAGQQTTTTTTTETTGGQTPAGPVAEGPKPTASEETIARAAQITQIGLDAPNIAKSGSLAEYASNLGDTRDTVREANVTKNIFPKVNIDSLFNPQGLERVKGFITYGTDTTQIGEGERAGVLNSYIAAYGKAPSTDAEWSDLLKIASGRFPSELATKTASRSAINFQKTYGRSPRAANANDQAAMNIMQYGLLPAKTVRVVGDGVAVVPNRDTAKERSAILVFKRKFGFAPVAATAWNVVRAIAYSGTPVR